jgi:hypothetical protein
LIKFKYGSNISHLFPLSLIKFRYGKTDHKIIFL